MFTAKEDPTASHRMDSLSQNASVSLWTLATDKKQTESPGAGQWKHG